jgi:hypothetical protein
MIQLASSVKRDSLSLIWFILHTVHNIILKGIVYVRTLEKYNIYAESIANDTSVIS